MKVVGVLTAVAEGAHLRWRGGARRDLVAPQRQLAHQRRHRRRARRVGRRRRVRCAAATPCAEQRLGRDTYVEAEGHAERTRREGRRRRQPEHVAAPHGLGRLVRGHAAAAVRLLAAAD